MSGIIHPFHHHRHTRGHMQLPGEGPGFWMWRLLVSSWVISWEGYWLLLDLSIYTHYFHRSSDTIVTHCWHEQWCGRGLPPGCFSCHIPIWTLLISVPASPTGAPARIPSSFVRALSSACFGIWFPPSIWSYCLLTFRHPSQFPLMRPSPAFQNSYDFFVKTHFSWISRDLYGDIAVVHMVLLIQ